ncbi:MAG: hypothetical protein AAFU71_05135 [Cyanobacteria bacterium J06632_22]
MTNQNRGRFGHRAMAAAISLDFFNIDFAIYVGSILALKFPAWSPVPRRRTQTPKKAFVATAI